MFRAAYNLRFLCLLFLLLVSENIKLNAQYSPYTTLTADDGLPSNYIYRIAQDKLGHIWISSLDGIAKYDGYSINKYTVPDGLPNDDVFEIIEDHQGRMWLLNDANVLSYMKNDSVFSFKNNISNRIFIDQLTKDSVFIDDGTVIHVFDCEDHHSEISRSLYYQREGRKFGISEENPKKAMAMILDGSEATHLQQLKNLANHRLYFRTEDQNKVFYKSLGSNETKFKPIDSNKLWDVQRPIASLDIHRNTIQVYHGDNLYIIDENMNMDSVTVTLPPYIDINTVFLDRQGNLWVSTKGGVLIVNSEIIENEIYFQEGTQGLDIDYLFPYENNYVYTTTDGKIFLLDKQGHHLIYTINATTRIDPIYDIEVRDHKLYFAYKNEGIRQLDLSRYDGEVLESKKYKLATLPSGLNKEQRYTIGKVARRNVSPKKFIIDTSVITIMTRSGLVYYDKIEQVGEMLTKSYSLDYDIFKKNIIHTNETGITEIRNGKSLNYHEEIEKVTLCRYLDSERYLLFSALLESYICDKNGCEKQAILDGYDIKDLQIIDGEIWLVHHAGILHCRYEDAQKNLEIIHNYPINQLTSSNEVKSLIVEKERIIVGTNKGIYYANKADFGIERNEMNFYIKEIRSSEETFEMPTEITIPHADRSLEVEYTALSYKANTQISYYYQLENIDRTTQVTNSRVIRYPELNPGNYIFTIQAKDQIGGVSKVHTIRINVLRPWWLSYYFLIFCIATIFFSLYYLYQRREKQLNEKAELSQKFAELELNALQSQMNPHFVFNAMGSLQNLVQNNEVEIADMYIAKFAKLMRMFLEGSMHKFVSIREEIDIVLAYFELEKLRFQDKISLVYENNLSALQMQQEIPANLLQPFIENAINHGIFHKKHGGTIMLQLFDKGSEIGINIIDDGVGRAKAAEYKSQDNSVHVSRAIEILNDKIIAIKKLEGMSIEYKIIDLTKNGMAAGTKVSLRIKKEKIRE